MLFGTSSIAFHPDGKLMPFPSALVRSLSRLSALPVVALSATTDRLAAQNIAAHSDGADARIDAMFGTPERYGVMPQDNVFATTPGLEQQARVQRFTFNILVPIGFNSNPEELNTAF